MRIDDALKKRDDIVDVADLHIGDEDIGIFKFRHHLLAIGHHVGREIAFVIFQPWLMTSSSSEVLDSSTVITPDLPTLSIA
jgi:hypothetical protein